jgi:cysteinyl-tRNA synthetase
MIALLDSDISPGVKLATVLEIDKSLGLGFIEYYAPDRTLPKEIEALTRERNLARTGQDYAKSDELRDILNSRGYIVIDLKDSSIVAKNPLK